MIGRTLLAAALLLTPLAVRGDEELEAHLSLLRKQVDDPTLDVPRRERLVLEMAATLDRAAQAATTAETRRLRWTEAIQLLDDFHKRNPDQPQARPFELQTAVYLWARGESWARQWELAPTDQAAHAHAVENLDAALARLRSLDGELRGKTDLLAQNVRFRLAQALADRAELDPPAAPDRLERLREALKALDPPVAAPALRGFASVLRATIEARLGHHDEALKACDDAAKATPAPPALDLLTARVAIRIGQARFDDALGEIARAKVEAAEKPALTARVLLAQRRAAPAGSGRADVETRLFRALKTLRAAKSPEARLALLAAARDLSQPDATQEPDAWDLLAEGAVLRGDLARAAALDARGADRARALDRPDEAATLRLRSGAYLFQAGQYVEADAPLSQVADDPRAGDLRARAGLLRILARGQALARKLPGASRAGYVAALEAQIRDFPDDPSAGEARWLLGNLKLSTGDREAALALWSAIPRGEPRWIDARLAVARHRQELLDTQRLNNEHAPVAQRYEEARSFLATTLEQARDDRERSAVRLVQARLELTPDAGHPEEARDLTERVLRTASLPDQHDEARRLHLVALAALGRFVEAEQEARVAVPQAKPEALLATARLLDHVASESESDVRLRRFGLILRVVLARVLQRPDDLAPAGRAEAQLRQARALVFSGDAARARDALAVWQNPPEALDDALLKDLADTYVRLDAFELAADVQRLRTRRALTGSLPWFAARYGLALAYYRAGRTRDARQLIDGTAILHPELGGGALRDKFVRLRQRLGPDG